MLAWLFYSYIPSFQHYFPKDDAGPTTVVIGKGKLRSASLARTGIFNHEKSFLKNTVNFTWFEEDLSQNHSVINSTVGGDWSCSTIVVVSARIRTGQTGGDEKEDLENKSRYGSEQFEDINTKNTANISVSCLRSTNSHCYPLTLFILDKKDD